MAVELLTKMSLTVDSFTQLWEKKFLPSIRAEFKAEITVSRQEMKDLSKKINEIEDSKMAARRIRQYYKNHPSDEETGRGHH